MSKKECYYADYLKLDSLFACLTQSSLYAHDEHLFITVHQNHELWFRQIIFELQSVKVMMSSETSHLELPKVNNRLERCIKIFELLIAQIDILETMSPLAFLEFRDKIIPASGFQSLQFRLLEQLLGVNLVLAQGCPHYRLNEKDYSSLVASYQESNIHQILINLVANLPYAKEELPIFWQSYLEEMIRVYVDERDCIVENPNLSKTEKKRLIAQLNQHQELFTQWYDAPSSSLIRAKFVSLYIFLHQEDGLINPWYRLLKNLMDMDEKLSLWRFHHYMMVQQMIGHKVGTGGSAGQIYLQKHIENHKAFQFLLEIINFLLPQKQIPKFSSNG